MKSLKIILMSFFVGSIAIACTTYDNGYYGNNGRVYRAPDGGTYRSGQIYRDRNGNVYRDGRIYRYGGNDTYGYGGYRNGKKLPPGQAKKIYGGSAKDYAPGQQKKYYKNDHHYKNKKYKKIKNITIVTTINKKGRPIGLPFFMF